MLTVMLGTCDYRKELDLSAWEYCYTTQCCKAPTLYPETFKDAADNILHHNLHMEKCGITTHNAKHVYMHLLRTFTDH